MTGRRRFVLSALALVSAVALSGCARGCTSSRPPIHLNPSMFVHGLDPIPTNLPETDRKSTRLNSSH